MMERRLLGHTGLEVSLLGLGTVKFGRREGVRYPQDFDLPDDRSVIRLLDLAREHGINLLDTAPAYGSSEARLGALLRDQRNQWLLSTKVGEQFEAGQSRYDFTPEAVQQSIKRSLQHLRTDRLDIVLIHSDGRDREILQRFGTLECLFDLKQRGWIRAVGISHKTVTGGELAIDLGCDVIMATLNIDATEERELIAAAGRKGCGVLIKKAMASGHAGVDSLRFAASQPGVSSVIIGTIDPAHLLADVEAVKNLEGRGTGDQSRP